MKVPFPSSSLSRPSRALLISRASAPRASVEEALRGMGMTVEVHSPDSDLLKATKSNDYSILVICEEEGQDPELDLIHHLGQDLPVLPILIVGTGASHAAFRAAAIAAGFLVRQIGRDQLDDLAFAVDEMSRQMALEREVVKMKTDLHRLRTLLDSANTRVLEQRRRLLSQERLRASLERTESAIMRLNQPLSVLLGGVDLLRTRLGGSDDQLASLAMRIVEGAEEISAHVERVRNLHQHQLQAHLRGDYILDLDGETQRLLVAVPTREQRDQIFGMLGRQREGADLHWCADAPAALGTLERGQIDAALIDSQLPGAMGVDLLREIRRRRLPTTAVMLVATGDEALIGEALRLGAADYLPWSLLTPETLAEAIHQATFLSKISESVVSIEERLHSQAAQDPSTGLTNLPRFHTLLAEEFERARRHSRPLAVAAFEIVGWEDIAGEIGLERAEERIQRIGRAIARHLRRADCVAPLSPGRFGGVLPETSEGGVVCLLDRLTQMVAEDGRRQRGGDGAGEIRICSGLSQIDDCPPPRSGAEMFKRAGEALAQARIRGDVGTHLWRPSESSGGGRGGDSR